MSLQIVLIQNNGDASEEYVLLKATRAINLNNYAIVDRTFDEEGNVSNIHRHFYRFPLQEVREGEYISLRTSKGNYKYGTLKDGSPVHRFYWGSDAPIWNDSNAESAEVLELKTVNRKTTGHPAQKKKTPFEFMPRRLKSGGKD
jgi:hypothetical protein